MTEFTGIYREIVGSNYTNLPGAGREREGKKEGRRT